MKKINLFLFIFFIIVLFPLFAADDWTLKSPATNPSGRLVFGMAYGGLDQVVLFGGSGGASGDETWVYDLSANTWTNVETGHTWISGTNKPESRRYHELAYIGDDKVILFGGVLNGGSTRMNDTWIYDLSDNTWTEMTTIGAPSARFGTAMGYIGSDQVLLFGGHDNTNKLSDTWIYDLSTNTWSSAITVTIPVGRYDHEMSYLGSDKVLMFGGDIDGAGCGDKTWIYSTGIGWTDMSPATTPPSRAYLDLAYMGDDKVLMFGGSCGWPPGLTDTYIYDLSDNNWTIDANSTTPAPRHTLGLSETSMDGTSSIVLFSGNYSGGYYEDTWTFGGGDYPLPVELSSFTVEATNQGVLCEWTTESEIENLGFILERKTEGNTWYELASYKTDDGLLGQGTVSYPTDYKYLDSFVEPNTTYEYRLADVDYDGVVTYHATRMVTVKQAPLTSKVEKFTVLPAYPNPFNPSTTITYGINEDSKVIVQIYNITGQYITTLVNNEQSSGWHSIIWDGTNNNNEQVPAGLYFSRITAGNDVKTTKLMLLK